MKLRVPHTFALLFGLVAVAGTAYLQALRLDPLFLVAAERALEPGDL